MASNGWWCVSEKPNTWDNPEPATKARRGKPKTSPWQTCTKEDIKEYRGFRKLYGERKFARSFPKQKQTLSFTDDLPPELRLIVYDHLFKIPNHFEFWAPWDMIKEDITSWVPTNRFDSTDSSRCHNRFREYAVSTKALKIMRLSKKVHNEVSFHFYSHINFRFSTWNGFQAMTVFNNTIRQDNCNLIKHITVQIPNRDDLFIKQGANACMYYNAEWNAFEHIHKKRGMCIPDFGLRNRHSIKGRMRGEFNYHKAVLRGYRQLAGMAGLQTLEVLIPWDYNFTQGTLPPAQWCECPAPEEELAELTPQDVVRHTVEEHSSDPEYWRLLADLKEQRGADSASADLTISLVLMHDKRDRVDQDKKYFLLQGRWLAAYAKVMGYRFGHTRWEKDNSTYVVRYDEDEMLAVSDDSADLVLEEEPPELP